MATPTLDEFLSAARADNPGVSDGQLANYWLKTYAGSKGELPKSEATAGGLIRSFGSSAIDTVGSAFQGGGEVVAAGLRAATGDQDIRAANPLRPVTDAIRGGMSEGDKLASQDTFKGDITSPSTIELPKTAGGWAHAIASGFGSLSSMILPGAMAMTGARGMIAGGAVAGALTTGGAAADEVRQNVQRAMEGKTPEQLAQAVPAYRDALAQGMDDATARQKVENDAAILATAVAGAAGAAGGAFNAKILEDVVAKRGLATLLGKVSGSKAGQIGIGAGVGTVAEGLQEGLEKVGQNVGENIGMGKPAMENATRDTAGDVIMGGLIGGVTGGVAGAVTQRPTEAPAAKAAAERVAAVQEIATAPNVDTAIEAFQRATAPDPIEFDRLGALGLINSPVTPSVADTGETIPYDYSTRQQMYPALPAPEAPSGRDVLVNDTDPQLTRPEQMGDREAAINYQQAQREQAESDRDLGITPGTRKAIRSRITLDEAGNIIDAPDGDRQFLALVRREARPHAAAAIEAHAINPTLTEAVLAAPNMGPRAERTVFEAIINGNPADQQTRTLLERYGVPGRLADANRQSQESVNPPAPGEQPAGNTGSERRPAEAGIPGTGTDTASDNRNQGVITPPGQIAVENLQKTTPAKVEGKPITDRTDAELRLQAKNTRDQGQLKAISDELARRKMQASAPATEGKATAPVPAPRLYVQSPDGKRFEVESLEDASRKWISSGTQAQRAAIMGDKAAVPIADESGKTVALMDSSGRVSKMTGVDTPAGSDTTLVTPEKDVTPAKKITKVGGKLISDTKLPELRRIVARTKVAKVREAVQAEITRREELRAASQSPDARLKRAQDKSRKGVWRAIVAAGGISEKEAADLNIDPRSLGGYRMSGLITKSGMRSDILAEFLFNEGYLSDADMQDGGDGAARQFVQDMLAGEFVGNAEQANEYHALLSESHDEAAIEASGFDDAPIEVQAEVADFDVDFGGKSNVTEDEFLAALGADEQEIEDARKPRSGEGSGEVAADQGRARQTGRDEPAGPQDRAAPGRSEIPQEPAFALDSQTSEDLAAQARAAEEAQAAADKAAKAKDEAERQERVRKEIAARSVAAAGEFQLGQTQAEAEATLAGQGDIFSQPAAKPEKPKGDTDASLDRSRPREFMAFSKPYEGAAGAKLVGYEWAQRKEEYVDRRGENRTRRVSDWEQAVKNLQTGRDVVHQFHITTKDGESRVVSAETAATMLGVAQSTVRTNAARLLQQEIDARNKQDAESARVAVLDAMESFATPAAAIESRKPDGYMQRVVDRALSEGKTWGSADGDAPGREKYRFLKRDGKFIFSPELVTDGSVLHAAGWRTVELRANEIWNKEGEDKAAAFRKMVAEQKAGRSRLEAKLARLFERDGAVKGIRKESKYGQYLLLTAGMSGTPYRVTSIDDQGPSGHRDYNSIAEAANEFISNDIAIVDGPAPKVAKPVTPQVASAGMLKTFIGIAADSIEQLRKVDVERVLTSNPKIYQAAIAQHIKDKRPDLAGEVDDVLSDQPPPTPVAEKKLPDWRQTITSAMSRSVFRDIVPESVQKDGQRVLDAIRAGDLEALAAMQKKYMQEAGRDQGGGGAGPGKVKQARRGVVDVFQLSILATQRLEEEKALKESQVPAPSEPVAPAQEKAELKAESVSRETPNTEDAGAELSYNRRNRTRGGLKWEDLEGKNETLRVSETNKANVYARPDYEKLIADGMNPLIAHIVKQAYDSIAATPNGEPTDSNLKTYINAVNRIMDGVMAWTQDADAVRAWATKQARVAGAMRGNTIELAKLAPAEGKNLLDIVYPDGWRNHRAELMIAGGNKVLSALQPASREAQKASKAIGDGWPAKQEAWQKSFDIRQIEMRARWIPGADPNGEPQQRWAVYSKNSRISMARNHPDGGFATQDEATAWAREQAKRGAKTGISDKGISVEMARREGPARRMEGEDISSDRLKETFGFKGVNFGTWMKGDSNKAERQLHLNHAYDAFMDLAEILGVPPKAMSLNGMMGIAFGAQGGGGGAAAHFVPGVNEINLTRTNGAGSLAHEWGHGVDHYFATQAGLAGRKEPFLTEHLTGGDGIRPEIVARFAAIVKAMNKKPETPDQVKLRMEAARAKSARQVNGWLASIKRDFMAAKVDEADFDKLAERIRTLDLGDGKIAAGTANLSPAVDELRGLYKTKTGRTYSLDQMKGLQSNVDHLEYLTSDKAAEKSHVPQQVTTDYATAAAALDKQKGGKAYWNTDLEKFARAFDAFVSDSLAEKAAKNSYLSHADRQDETTPRGDERKAIDREFQALVDTIETREGDNGNIALASRAKRGTGRGVSIPELTRLVEAMGGGIKIAATQGDLPESANRFRSEISTGVRGVFIPKTGEIYLVAENLQNLAEAAFVSLHEGAHRGLRKLFGDELKPVLNRIWLGNKNVRTKTAEYQAKYNIDKMEAIEEVLADMAMEGTAKDLTGWEMLVEFIKTWVKKFGDAIGAKLPITDDMVEMIVGAAARKGLEGDAVAFDDNQRASRLSDQLKGMNKDADKGLFQGDIDEILQERGETVATIMDAERRFNDGERLFIAHDMGETPTEVTSTTQLKGYTADQIIALPVDAELDGGMRSAAESEAKVVSSGLSADSARAVRIDRIVATQTNPADKARKRGFYDVMLGLPSRAADYSKILVVSYEQGMTRAKNLRRELDGKPWIETENVKDGAKWKWRVYREGYLVANGEESSETKAHDAIIGARVTLNEQDDAPLASRGTIAATWDMLQSASTPAQARTLAMNLFDNPNKFNLWDKTIGTQLNKARKNAYFRDVFDNLQIMQDDTAAFAIEAEAEAIDVLARMKGAGEVKSALKSTLSGERSKDLQAVSKAIFSNIEGKTGVKQKVFTDAELTAMGLNDRQIGQYRQARAAIDRSLDRYAQSLTIQVAQKFVNTSDLRRAGLDDTVEALTERMMLRRDVMEDLKDKSPAEIVRSMTMTPMGQSRMKDFQDDPNKALDAEIEAINAALAKLPEIQKQANGLKDAGYAPAMRFGDYSVTAWSYDPRTGERTAEFFTMTETKTGANLLKMRLAKEMPGREIEVSPVDKESFKLFKGVSPDTVELFARFMDVEQDAAFKEYIALAASSRSAMKRMLERKGVAGFSDNLPRVLSAFITSNARAAAQNLNSYAVNDAFEQIPQNQGDVRSEAAKLIDYMRNPQDEGAKIRGFMFAYFMGGSVSSALVNLTQPVMMTAPYLSQFVGAKIGGIMTRAAKMAATGKVTGDLKAAFERAEAEGVTDAHEYFQLMQEAEGGGSVPTRAAMKAWGSMFGAAERFNRRITFLAAYEVGKGMKQADLYAKGVGDAYEFAKMAVEETQGVYMRHNRPNWARGTVGALAFTFRQYSIAYIEFFMRLPRKQQLLAVGMLMLMAGIEGLPFAEDLEDLIDTIGQRMGYGTNSKRALHTAATNLFGETGAQFALHGISGISGIPMDVAGRLGMGNLIPGTKLLNPSVKEKAREVAEIAGPAAGLVQKAGGLADGQIKEAMPKAFADAAKAWEMLQTGEYRDTKGRKVMEIDGLDTLMKLIGFQPAEIAAKSRFQDEQRRDINIVKAVETEIVEQWADGVREKDVAKSQEARERLKRWNEENPDLPIKVKFSQVLQRVRAANLSRDERFMKTAPPEMRRRMLAEAVQ